jgi:hypothetical protein
MTKWTIEGTQIKKDGEEVFLTGVCYAPTPAGAATYEPGVGDWFTPPWEGIWERDLPKMQAMGVNNLRTYFFWAWTPPRDIANWERVTSGPPTFDHTAFLDAAHAHGISVTIGIALDGGSAFENGNPSLGRDYLSFYVATADKLAELYGDHPAVMGFCLGNEQNTPTRIRHADFWDGFERMARAVRAKAPDKLVMLAMQNDGGMFKAKVDDTPWSVPQRFAAIFDVWGLNVYSGMESTLSDYATYVAADNETQRPAIISEWGRIAGGTNEPPGSAGPPNGNATARPLTPAEFAAAIDERTRPDWEEVQKHRSFVAGAQFFAWSDEWWKNANTPVYEQNASASPDWPEEWWGLYAIAPVDRTAQRGPWNSDANAPYPPDELTARPTVAALTEMYAQVRG